MTQQELLKNHFSTGKSISAYEARDMYRINSLPRRIKDLEQGGLKINRERKVDNTGRQYVRYSKV